MDNHDVYYVWDLIPPVPSEEHGQLPATGAFMNSTMSSNSGLFQMNRKHILHTLIYFLMVALNLSPMWMKTALASFDPASYDAELDGLQKAFPTAEGFGKYAQGGRGGDVYIVSNLNDSGPGSLRECVEASGPRTCVFSVSGEIKTQKAIRARHPYLTIAGQTAPGDGIMLTIRDTDSVQYPLAIETQHVIIRHISVRPGPSRRPSDNVDAIVIGGGRGAQHIILDHVSMSWGTDETLNILGNSGITNRSGRANSKNITVQWSMIYESLEHANHPQYAHSRSTYLGYGVQDMTIHHNIIANSNRRNPNIGGVGQIDYINNVQFNSARLNGELYNRHGSSYFNWIGNVTIAGPNTPNRDNIYQASLFNNQDLGTLEMYVNDNIDIHRPSNTGDERLVINPTNYGLLTTAGPVGYRKLSLPSAEISEPEQAYKDVLAFAGATKPSRDSADARLVADVLQCKGDIIDHPNEVGGWPYLSSTTPPNDSDLDGMPDYWELDQGLNPYDSDDRNGDIDGDGYTNLEEYINELAGDNEGSKVGKGTGDNPDVTCGKFFYTRRLPAITHFDISPKAIKPGGSVTITWNADAVTCKRSWDRGGNPFLVSGTQTMQYSESTGIDLICNKDGVYSWENRYLFVTNSGNRPFPSISFSADRVALEYGDPVTFSWRVGSTTQFEAGECIASGAWNGFKTTAGQETFKAKNSGEYRLTCTGPGGSSTKSITLKVNGGKLPPTPTPTVTLNAHPVSIKAGASSTLTWSSTNATTCEASGNWSGNKRLNGSEIVSPGANSVYTLTCLGIGGSASDSATVSVTPIGFGIGSLVVLISPANLRYETLAGNSFRQPAGASGIITNGPINGGGGTKFWEIDFNSGPDGWVRDTQLKLN